MRESLYLNRSKPNQRTSPRTSQKPSSKSAAPKPAPKKNSAPRKKTAPVRAALVCTGGDFPPANICPWPFDACIAADAGVRTCAAMGYVPQVAIGDFDSVSREETRRLFPDAKIIKHKARKDYSDTELAVRYAREAGFEDITVVGGGGGANIEHFVDILYLFSRAISPDRVITREYQIERVGKNFCADVGKGARISFFPLGTRALRQESRGLAWNLDQVSAATGLASLSNVATGRFVRVSVTSGILIAMWMHHNRAQRANKNLDRD